MLILVIAFMCVIYTWHEENMVLAHPAIIIHSLDLYADDTTNNHTNDPFQNLTPEHLFDPASPLSILVYISVFFCLSVPILLIIITAFAIAILVRLGKIKETLNTQRIQHIQPAQLPVTPQIAYHEPLPAQTGGPQTPAQQIQAPSPEPVRTQASAQVPQQQQTTTQQLQIPVQPQPQGVQYAPHQGMQPQVYSQPPTSKPLNNMVKIGIVVGIIALLVCIAVLVPVFLTSINENKPTNNNTNTEENKIAALKFTITGYQLEDMSKDGAWILGYFEDYEAEVFRVAGFSGTNGTKLWEFTIPKVYENVSGELQIISDFLDSAKITRNGEYALLMCEHTTKIIDKNGELVFNCQTYTYNGAEHHFGGGIIDIDGNGSRFVDGNPLTLFQRNGQILWTKYPEDVYGYISASVAISDDGSYISRRDYGNIFLYDANGNVLWKKSDGNITAHVHKFSPSGNIIFWGGLDGAMVMDLNGDTILSTSYNGDFGVFDMACSYNASEICFTGDGEIFYYTLRQSSTLTTPVWTKNVSGRAFSADMSDNGTLIAVQSDWGNVYLFKNDGKLLFTQDNDGGAGGKVIISSDGRYLCSYGDGGKIYFYEVNTSLFNQ